MANEALTADEKKLALEMNSIGIKGQPGAQGQPAPQAQAAITLAALAELGATPNDLVRAKILMYKADKAKAIADAIDKAQKLATAQVTNLQKQLADLQAQAG